LLLVVMGLDFFNGLHNEVNNKRSTHRIPRAKAINTPPIIIPSPP
jgi:hypothetical protein